MQVSPVDRYTVFDLEATDVDPGVAEIVQLAALRPGHAGFMCFVATASDIDPTHEVWAITGIDPAEHAAHKVPLDHALARFLTYIGDTPLAGHNILQYDLPLLSRHLELVGLELPVSALSVVDTLQWAHLLYPTPPDGLRGYRLGDLFEYFTGSEIDGAHRADRDCEANCVVIRELQLATPPPELMAIWTHLQLKEATLYPVAEVDPEHLATALRAHAHVPWLSTDGRSFPPVDELVPSWLLGLASAEIAEIASGNHQRYQQDARAADQAATCLALLQGVRRPQIEMLRLVAETLAGGGRQFLEAPTGTGKTRGYLFPMLGRRGKRDLRRSVVATHTKVLQEQAYEELRRVAGLGYEVRAVIVKSPRDYVCIDALHDAIADSARATTNEGLAMGVLAAFVRAGGYDLSALPVFWEFNEGYRELRFNVRTDPARCRRECPFVSHCAYQIDLAHRDEADIWVTNQAWMVHHLTQTEADDPKPDGQRMDLVIDEGHNLEDVATEAFTQRVGGEDVVFHLKRVFDPVRRRGWLRDNRYVPADMLEIANGIRNVLIPSALDKVRLYGEDLERFIKQYGSGDAHYGVAVALAPKLLLKPEWARLRFTEDACLAAVDSVRGELQRFPRDAWIGRNLRRTIEGLGEFAALIRSRRGAVRGDREGPQGMEYIHLSRWHVETGWVHDAEPVDVASVLNRLWARVASVTVTSATLAIDGRFDYIKRVLGLPDATARALEGTLPYGRSHLFIPSHLPEARPSNLFRFQPRLHQELRELLPRAKRSLSLFTSAARMKEAGAALEHVPNLYLPLTRRAREDVAAAMRRPGPAVALGTRAFMEGIDFPHLKLVTLERLPFPVPTALLKARQELAERQGFDPWSDVYLPRALLSFTQAFGRLIRDDRTQAGDGAFVLWDKRLLNASYQLMFLRNLPSGVQIHEPADRADFYQRLATVLEVDPTELPTAELIDDVEAFLSEVRGSDAPLDTKIAQVAKMYWDLDSGAIKAEQWLSMHAAMSDRDAVVLLPTGFGKSLTFQVPALLEGGVTLVVSPLIALMRDQVEALQQRGLPAAALHSMLTGAEQRSILDEVRAGRVQLLYVSPERVARSQDLLNVLRETAAGGKLRRLVLDEAHCLSEWGHDFRPDYLQVADRLRKLVPSLRVTALTATATERVHRDLQRHLALRQPEVVTASYDRPNLSYFVYPGNDITKLQRLVQILGYVEQEHTGDAVIVYAATRMQTERLAWALGQLGFAAEAYHAGLSAVVRNEVQERFMQGDAPVIVATSAFGMGIDKANVRVVVHFSPPTSVAAYIQESGRAGRDGAPGFAVLLHGGSDWRLARFIASLGHSRVEHARALLAALEPRGSVTMFRDEFVAFVNEQVPEDVDLLTEDALDSLLNALREVGALEASYRVGRVFLLALESEGLAPLWPELVRLGFRGRLQGDELDLRSLPTPEAEALNDMLYELRDRRVVRMIANREPALEVRVTPHASRMLPAFERLVADRTAGALLRVQAMREYATVGTCKRDYLLKAYGQSASTCSTCMICDQHQDAVTALSEPWLAVPEVEEAVIEAVYKPLETLLRYLDVHRGSMGNTGRDWLGQTRIVMALRGESMRHLADGPIRLSRTQQDNPYFARLGFVKPSEVERALTEARKRALVEVESFHHRPVFRISDAGRAYVLRGLRRQQRREPA